MAGHIVQENAKSSKETLPRRPTKIKAKQPRKYPQGTWHESSS